MSPQSANYGFAASSSSTEGPRKSLGESVVSTILAKVTQTQNMQANLASFVNTFGAPLPDVPSVPSPLRVSDTKMTIISAFDLLEAELNSLEIIVNRLR